MTYILVFIISYLLGGASMILIEASGKDDISEEKE